MYFLTINIFWQRRIISQLFKIYWILYCEHKIKNCEIGLFSKVKIEAARTYQCSENFIWFKKVLCLKSLSNVKFYISVFVLVVFRVQYVKIKSKLKAYSAVNLTKKWVVLVQNWSIFLLYIKKVFIETYN